MHFFLKSLFIFITVIFALPFNTLCAESPRHAPFIIHAIPKCGTHLFQRLITLLTEKNVLHLHLSQESVDEAHTEGFILRIFQEYDIKLLPSLVKQRHKVMAICRDPRDALISHLFYMREFQGMPANRDFFTVSENFDTLTFEEQLTSLITGTSDMQSYLSFYMSRIGWALSPFSLTVKFEDLLPTEGGGNDMLQQICITRIADYIGLELTDESLQNILDNLYVKYEDTPLDDRVFIRASKDNWKTFFTEKQKKLFKKKCGSLLIKLGYEKNNSW